MRRRTLLTSAIAFLTATGVGVAAGEDPGVLVFAAASLKNALDAIAAKWQADSGRRATGSYGASSTLAKQIDNGAPADLFISADLDWMDYLQRKGLIDPSSRRNLLGNQLVLIAPKASAAEIAIAPGFPLRQLLGDGRLAMADPNAVPAGKYAKSALEKLGVWDAVAGRVAAAENVRAALLLVARGEAPLGIVYRTDAMVEPGVRILAAFPAGTHPPITYPMALTRNAAPGSAQLAGYLQGPAARALFEAQGFTVLAGER